MHRITLLRLAALTLVAAAMLPAQAGAAGATGRTHYLSASAYSFWHLQAGCDVRDVQVYGFDSSVRSRLDETAQSDVGVFVNESTPAPARRKLHGRAPSRLLPRESRSRPIWPPGRSAPRSL